MGVDDRALMSWDPARARWQKMFRGTYYKVSCSQLGVRPTKEASYRAANEWWRNKLAELQGQPQDRHPHQAALDDLDARISWAKRHGHERAADDLTQKRQIVQSLPEGADDLADTVVSYSDETEEMVALARLHGIEVPRTLDPRVKDLIFGKSRIWEARLEAESDPGLPEERTLGGLCSRYLEQHDLRRRAGDLSPGEYYLIGHHTKGFVDWVGGGRPSDAISPSRWEDYWKHLMKRVGEGEISPAYATKYMKYARRFVVWMASMGLVTVPPNLHNKGYKFPTTNKALAIFSSDEARRLVEAAPGQLKLHLLLMLNCGFTQSDIASLRHGELDLERGKITRKRSKTRQHHGGSVPTVTWTLWPATLELLRKYRSAHPTLALTTERGKPWVEEGIKPDGKPYSRDAIQSNFRHIQKRLGQTKTLKAFRKTSASMLDGHPEYGRYAQHFLGHAPDTVAGRHYVTPSQAQFDAALTWMGCQFGFTG